MRNKSIVRFKRAHYKLVCSWFNERGITPPSLSTLSDAGFICDGRVAAWLYITNSNAAMIEWVIADPNTVPSLRKESLRKLMGFMVDYCLMLGFTNIFGISKNPAMGQVASQLGFSKGEYTVYTLSEE